MKILNFLLGIIIMTSVTLGSPTASEIDDHKILTEGEILKMSFNKEFNHHYFTVKYERKTYTCTTDEVRIRCKEL